jgi:Zn-dependent protease with chaperone function
VTQRNAAPWCPDCEWGLDRYEPARRRPEMGWRWADRLLFRAAYRLTDRQYSALLGRAIGRGGWGPARWGLLVAAVVLLAAVLACLGAGVYLIADHFPSWRIAPGVVLVLLAIGLWPRLGRLDRYSRQIPRDQAPALYRLLDEVAAAIGAPAPHIVEVDSSFNASAGSIGVLRKRVVRLGMPLWALLPPQQRVALLGHEMGHFVNGDAARGPVTQIPLTTLGRLADLLRPAGWRLNRRGTSTLTQTMRGTNIVAEMITGVVLTVAHGIVRSGHVVLVWICMRDSQRAEYLADQLAARAGGSTAAAALLDSLMMSDSMAMVARREARGGVAVSGWLAAADALRVEVAPRLSGMRQLSARDEVSMFATHPPTGMRARMIESRTYEPAAVTLTAADSQRIDNELAKPLADARRDLAAS